MNGRPGNAARCTPARAWIAVLVALAACLTFGPAATASAPFVGAAGSGEPPAPNCGSQVPAYARGHWRCVSAGPPINDGLTLIASEVPGLRAIGHGNSAARAALGIAIPARRAGRAAAAATFDGRDQRLSTATFTRRDAAAARALIGSASRGFHTLTGVGDEAKLMVAGGRSHGSPIAAVVLLRVGRAVGVVRLAVSSSSSPPKGNRFKAVAPARMRRYVAALSGDDATTLAGRLQRVLSLTPWQRNIDHISPTGAVSKAVALRAFALQYGSLPGVPHAQGATGAPTSGTLATGMVLGVWSRLSAAQRAAIDRDLGQRSGAGSSVRANATPAPTPAPGLTPDPVDQAVVQHWVQAFAAKLPGAPSFPVKVFRSSVSLGNTLADAFPVDAAGDLTAGPQMAYCRVRVAPSLLTKSASYRILSLAHEAFHCEQFKLDAAWPQLAPWILEGMAEWASQAIDPVPAAVGDEWYRVYLGTATNPLFGRSYDSDGFWGYAEEIAGRGSLWSKVPAILAAGSGSSASAFAAAGASTTAFRETWASAAMRYQPGGAPWNQTDPYQLSMSQVRSPVQALDADGAAPTVAPYSIGLYVVRPDPDSPLLSVVPIYGATRAADGPDGGDLGVISSAQYFCAGGDCECPPDTTGTIPQHRDLNGDLLLALTGGDDIGQVRITSHSLDEFCHPDPSSGGGGGGSGAGGRGGIAVYTPGQSSEIFQADMTTGSCSVSGGALDATASGGGYTMHAHVAGATRPGTLYLIPSGSASSYVNVNGYSSTAALKTGLGAVKFKSVFVKGKRHLRLSIGYDALFKGQSELVIAPEPGGLLC